MKNPYSQSAIALTTPCRACGYERDYLQRIAKLDWFSGKVAAVLLQIEAKVKASMGVKNA